MLDAYIIDAIRREELERERQAEQGRRIWLEIPQPNIWDTPRTPDQGPDDERGVVIIPLYPEDEAEDAA